MNPPRTTAEVITVIQEREWPPFGAEYEMHDALRDALSEAGCVTALYEAVFLGRQYHLPYQREDKFDQQAVFPALKDPATIEELRAAMQEYIVASAKLAKLYCQIFYPERLAEGEGEAITGDREGVGRFCGWSDGHSRAPERLAQEKTDLE